MSRSSPGKLTGEALLEDYLQALSQEFPRLRIVDKVHDRCSRVLSFVLLCVTLGGQRHYLDRYVTTLGQTILVPAGWGDLPPESRYLTLRHEAVHLCQFRTLGWPLMTFLYLFPILPVGLAAGRAWLEWQAYREGLVALAELRGLPAAQDPRLHASIVQQFVGGAYGYMWPFRRQVEAWIDRALDDLVRSSRGVEP